MKTKQEINYEKMLKEVVEEKLSESNNSELNLPIIYSLIDKVGKEKGFEVIDDTVSNFFILHKKAKTKAIVDKLKNQYEKRTLRKKFWENCQSLNLQKMKHFFLEVEAYIYSDAETRQILLKSLQNYANKITELEKRQVIELVYTTIEDYYTQDMDFCEFNKCFLSLTK